MNLDIMLRAPLVVNDFQFILRGAAITIMLCIVAVIIGSLLGLIFGILRTVNIAPVRFVAWLYVYVIRGTPLLMQLFLFYYGLPLLGIHVSPWTTAILSLSLYAGAYLTEIVKAGIQSVDTGQFEAAKALGLTKMQSFVHVQFPQALRVIVPPTVGFYIALVKDSSLVSAIGFIELTRSGRWIIARTFQPFTVYFIIAIVYFLICFFLSKISKRIERKMVFKT